MSSNKKPTNHAHRDVNAALRVEQAIRLRAQRLSYTEIARRCGYADRASAYNAIQRELARSISRNIDELRREEAAMYDDLQAAVYPLAVGNRDLAGALAGDDLGADGATLDAAADDLVDEDADEQGDERDAPAAHRRKRRPDINAGRLVIEISAARRKLLGLDATKDEAGATPVERRYIGINVEAV